MAEKLMKDRITAKGTEISVLSVGSSDDFISLTDIARYKNPHEPKDVVANWMRLRNTIEYLGIWEQLNNPNFKGVEFDPFLHEAGSNAFTLSPQRWIDATNAIGIVSRSGRGGGTYAHKDILYEIMLKMGIPLNYTITQITAAEEAFEDSTAMSNAHYILKDRDIEMKLL